MISFSIPEGAMVRTRRQKKKLLGGFLLGHATDRNGPICTNIQELCQSIAMKVMKIIIIGKSIGKNHRRKYGNNDGDAWGKYIIILFRE